MRNGRLAAVVLACVLSCLAGPAAAWSNLGHRISALIAYERLTPVAKARIERLLIRGADDLADPDFADSATWADALQLDEPRTEAWHMAAFPLGKTTSFDDCPATGGEADDCVVGKLYAFADQLERAPTDARALKFLMHLVGDVHQPLQVVDNGDSGGDCARVLARRGVANTSLRTYWDVRAVRDLGGSAEDVAKRLSAGITPQDAEAWIADLKGPLGRRPAGWAAVWAQESYDLAMTQAYPRLRFRGCGLPLLLTTEYARNAQAVTGAQLQKSGVRMAFLLNRLFDR